MTFTITKKQVLTTVLLLLLVAGISSGIYFFIQFRKSQALLKNPTEAAKSENKQIIDAVANMVDVPTGEEPTVASVTDKSKLEGQPFFAKAQNGDRVIFYPDSKRAILYRPSTSKIIEMSVVSVSGDVAGATAPTPTGTSSNPTNFTTLITTTPPSTPKTFHVALYNGTETPKLANNMEKLVNEKLSVATVVKKDNAAKTDYAKTLVIDLKGNFTTEAKSLSALINGEMTTLPDGETAPEADVLVIIGTNWKP